MRNGGRQKDYHLVLNSKQLTSSGFVCAGAAQRLLLLLLVVLIIINFSLRVDKHPTGNAQRKENQAVVICLIGCCILQQKIIIYFLFPRGQQSTYTFSVVVSIFI